MAGKGIVDYVPNYEHCRCDKCGGIIGCYGRNGMVCEQCGKEFKVYELDHNDLKINMKTGWIFPVKYKR